MVEERRYPGEEGGEIRYDLKRMLEKVRVYEENHKLSEEWERKEKEEGKVLSDLRSCQRAAHVRF